LLAASSLRGQEESVHIVTEFLRRPHKIYSYIYEVVDPDSPNFEGVDYATSEIQLSAGHYYRVRLNDLMSFPQFVELLAEIPKESVSEAGVATARRRSFPGSW
jgi:hypothetical protein